MRNQLKSYLIKLNSRNKQTAMAGEVIIDKSSCDGCGVCVNNCPNKVLILKDISDKELTDLSFKGKLKVAFKGKKKAYVCHLDSCIFCGLCEKNCHEFAIQVGNSVKKQKA